MVRKSIYLKNSSKFLILSDSLLKRFKTISFDVLSVPGARPQDLWDFLPPFNRFEKIILFVGGNALEDFQSKNGTFRSAQEPIEVATEIFELARALLLRTLTVFIAGVPPRGTEELQHKVLQLNAELNAFCNSQKQPIVFVGISHYLYDLKHISKDLCHFEKGAFAKIHKLLNEKILRKKFQKPCHCKTVHTFWKEYTTYPF